MFIFKSFPFLVNLGSYIYTNSNVTSLGAPCNLSSPIFVYFKLKSLGVPGLTFNLNYYSPGISNCLLHT